MCAFFSTVIVNWIMVCGYARVTYSASDLIYCKCFPFFNSECYSFHVSGMLITPVIYGHLGLCVTPLEDSNINHFAS